MRYCFVLALLVIVVSCKNPSVSNDSIVQEGEFHTSSHRDSSDLDIGLHSTRIEFIAQACSLTLLVIEPDSLVVYVMFNDSFFTIFSDDSVSGYYYLLCNPTQAERDSYK